ncbi:MAG: peptidase M61 [Cyclobacteriaceae bacterium]|nr:peptidase M61 [Cyclobacteriaceae bacterium]
MMKSKILLIAGLCLSFAAFSQSKKAYEYTVDLTRVVDDKLYVEMSPPSLTQDEITFYLPKIIPGTYAVQDYGRFVSDFKALDKKGNPLPVEKLETNAWKIKSAKKLNKISYWIEDTFDTQLAGPDVFWPAGTNIEENKNYVLNPSGFFGYFDQMKQTPFRFNIVRQKDFYGSTGLIPEKSNEPLSNLKLEAKPGPDKRVDVFMAEDFDRLADSPLMYAKTDTAVIKVANTEVLIGSYSPNGVISAKEIANSVKEVLMAQKEYLGGTLPVEKYAFIFYFTDQPVTSYGALEHSYSSFYYMPERSIDRMKQNLRDFAAHEFFHIVTPLTIHSEEIGHFDFNDPKMSQHLWLYEGVTEYFSGNMQVKYELITPDQYLGILRQKLLIADGFKDDLPFTEFSEHVLDKYGDQFYNVYQKGAIIGMCLDIKLRKLSDSKYGLQDLIADLSKKYGKYKSFNDDQLFTEIGQLTYPEIEEFLRTYVAGSASLPLESIFKDVGVKYEKDVAQKDVSLGFDNSNVTVTQYNETPMITFQNTDRMNAQGKALGLKNGDMLVKVNDEKLPALGPEFSEFISTHKAAMKEGGTISYTVLRKSESGDYAEVRLEAPVKVIEVHKRHQLSFDENATADQLKLRKAWLVPAE